MVLEKFGQILQNLLQNFLIFIAFGGIFKISAIEFLVKKIFGLLKNLIFSIRKFLKSLFEEGVIKYPMTSWQVIFRPEADRAKYVMIISNSVRVLTSLSAMAKEDKFVGRENSQ